MKRKPVSKGYKVLRKRKKIAKQQELQGLRAWREEVFLRAGNRCEKCKDPTYLDPHHVFGRRYKSIATDPDNGVALCHYCHNQYAHAHPEEFEAWIIAKRGQAWYDNLLAKRNRGQGINGNNS